MSPDAGAMLYRLLPDYMRADDAAGDGTVAAILGAAGAGLQPAVDLLTLADPDTSVTGRCELADPYAVPRRMLPWLGWLAGVPLPTLPYSPRRNLLRNPSFETDASGWTAPSAARSTAAAAVGSASLRCTMDGPVGGATLTPGDRVAVTAGNTYSASATVWADTTAGPAQLALRWYDAGGVLLSSAFGPLVATPVGEWVRVTCTGLAPAGAVAADVLVCPGPVEALLRDAVWSIDAAHSSASGQTISNLGRGGSALDARRGSTGSVDGNDPTYLPFAGTPYVYLPGVAGNFLWIADAAPLDITGDIDIRLCVAMDDWTPSSVAVLATKWAGGQKSWMLWVDPSGKLVLYWSADGSTDMVKLSTVATGFADGTKQWIRVTLDVDNGASGNDVKFWTSSDGATWTQLGSTVTTAGVTSVFASTSAVTVGSDAGPAPVKIYRAQLLNGIAGTTVLDIDTSVLTSAGATSLTALTGQSVTITRASSGKKAAAVIAPVWLFGTDDYLEVPDNALLDFGPGDSFTALAVFRQWATPAAWANILDKESGARYIIANLGSAFQQFVEISDGTTPVANTQNPAPAAGSLNVIGLLRDTALDKVCAISNAAISTGVTDTTTGTLANAGALTIGRGSAGGGYADMELVAAAVFRRALTSTELATISAYYAAGTRTAGACYVDAVMVEAGETPGPYVDPTIATDIDPRALIANAASVRRGGSVGAIHAAAQRTLIGSRSCRVYVNASGTDPYLITVITLTSDTPDPVATLAAAWAEKPAGMNLELQVADGATWLDLAAAYPSWDAVVAAFGTWNDVALWLP